MIEIVTFLLVCAVVILLWCVINYRNETSKYKESLNQKSIDLETSKKQLEELILNPPNHKEVDKFIEKDKEKDIIHQKHLNTLNEEISKLKSNNSELLVHNKNWQELFDKKEKELSTLKDSLEETEEAKKKITSQKKSGEVRLGSIAEKLAPFLDYFEYNPANAHFLGQPIDYIVFEDDEIVFIEIKTGNSQLSKKQRHIRDLIKSKLVSWKEIRIK